MARRIPKYGSRRPVREHRAFPPLQHPPLGVAGYLARAVIDSPLSPLLMAATLAVGVLAVLFTPRQEDPQISVPMIDVFIRCPRCGPMARRP
jgi:hypothetical protein